ncbi:unnamed protein product, partial [Symbiodinium sp. CCMP2456]
ENPDGTKHVGDYRCKVGGGSQHQARGSPASLGGLPREKKGRRPAIAPEGAERPLRPNGA